MTVFLYLRIKKVPAGKRVLPIGNEAKYIRVVTSNDIKKLPKAIPESFLIHIFKYDKLKFILLLIVFCLPIFYI